MITPEVRREWRSFQIASIAFVVLACAVTRANTAEGAMLKIMSGGQTGADRGALEAAAELGAPYGGWVPLGRKAEDGVVPARFDQLKEMMTTDYSRRTWANVRDSHGTVVVCPTPATGGSAQTLRHCRMQGRPLLLRNAQSVIECPEQAGDHLWAWCQDAMVGVLNVAGSRESKCPGIQAAVRDMVAHVLRLSQEEAGGG
jgi:hypothetical protein